MAKKQCRARVANVSVAILAKRPTWQLVYEGYPKSGSGDLGAEEVFTSILGENYDTKIFSNACATRVSLGLLNGNMKVATAFPIQNPKHQFYGKGFQSSARGLKDWLSKPNVWGVADVIICNPTSLEEVVSKINHSNRVRNGVYIIVDGFSRGISGHATLWIGKQGNVIGGNHFIGIGKEIHFWELR